MAVLLHSARRFNCSGCARLPRPVSGAVSSSIPLPRRESCDGVDIRYAIGASLASVIATSSGAAAAYVREGFGNIRIGMFLEIATTLGAIGGAFLAELHVPSGSWR